MSKHKYSRQCRVSLQLKAVLIVACVVSFAAGSGGWFYFTATGDMLRSEDQRRAMRIGQALGLAVQHDLRNGKPDGVQRLVSEYLRNENIRYVAILDADRQVIASARQEDVFGSFSGLMSHAPSVSTTYRDVERDMMLLAHPIVLQDSGRPEDSLAGAVRLVLDTGATTAKLTRVRQRMAIVAAAIVLVAIPLGYLLVWRVMVQPIRKLVGAARRLGEGDFSSRSLVMRNDELGELAEAFDKMADEVAAMRDELVVANEELEQKVAERTEDLEVANRRLRQEMTEKVNFLRAVSHDLNAPLRNIAGMATLAMMKWKDEMPEEVFSKLRRIQANVEMGSSLIGELLELSRIHTMPQRREMVDMGELMGEVVATFEFELKKRNIALDICSPLPCLFVERSRMRQVFQNLFDNAIKYMNRADDGTIDVGYAQIGPDHILSVTDNGPGIAPDQQEKVFQVFRRSTGAADAKVPGKGVGLALIRSVVANYGGRVWLESEVGRGSSFFVSLPVKDTCSPEEAPGLEHGTEEDAQKSYHTVG